MSQIPFDEDNVKQYLDSAIKLWRINLQNAKEFKNTEEELVASCYIDAYQSMRISIFGELLPKDE